MAFVRASYWDVEGDFTPDGAAPAVHRPPLGGRRRPRRHRPRLRRRRPPRAAGRQERRAPRRGARDPHRRGVPATDRPRHRRAGEALHASPVGARSRPRPSSRRPRASCACSSKNAMRVAQRLYENGYITYMRTDSTTLSDAAMTAARSQARDMYGAEYVPDSPRRYEKKVKNAQEAHEAIRPAGDRFRSPAQVAGDAARRGVRALRADLEAHRRLADGRRPRLDRHRQARRRHRGRGGAVGRVQRERHRHHLQGLPRRLRGGPRRRGRRPRRRRRRGAPPAQADHRGRRSRSCAPRPTATRRARPPATPRPPSSRRWRSAASGDRRRMPRRSARSRTAVTSSPRVRPSCRRGWPSP